ncbi:MAG: GNAT family N-acetyltransferase [Paracoccaceae bacterium]
MTFAELAALHASAFTVPRPWSEAEITDLAHAPGVFVLHEAQGFCIGRALAGEAELLTLAVAPAMRRQGLGGRLLSRFEDEARRLGATQAFLEVAADNQPALALYRGAGWEDAGRRPGYFRLAEGTSIDALLLKKALTGS